MNESSLPSMLTSTAAEQGWLERLARSLVRDDAIAADIVQSTWLSALTERGPVQRARAWLASVARNHARQEQRSSRRRARREQVVATANGDAGVDPVATSLRFELQRTVTRAVEALEEPFRSTVVLHYFEGLALVEIARRQRVPEGTVRSRLHRGHALLRTRLERDLGDGWRTALLPMCSTIGARGLGASWRRWAIGVGAATILVPMTMLVFGDAAAPSAPDWVPAVPAAMARVEPVAPAAGTAAAESRPVPSQRRLVAPVPALQPTTTAPIADQFAILRARLVGADGRAVAGARLELMAVESNGWRVQAQELASVAPPVVADATGSATLVLRAPAELLNTLPAGMRSSGDNCWGLVLGASALGHVRSEHTVFAAHGDDLDLGDLRLELEAMVGGRVVDERGTPIGGAIVGAFAPPLPATADDCFVGGELKDTAVATATAATWRGAGTFTLTNVPRGPVFVVAKAPGHRANGIAVELRATRSSLGDLVLAQSPADDDVPAYGSLRVRVLTADGNPCAGALVAYRGASGATSGTSGEDGVTHFSRVPQSHLNNGVLVILDRTNVHAPITEPFASAGTKDNHIERRLQPARATAVDVVAASGQLPDDIQVFWQAADDNTLVHAATRHDGAFSIVPPPVAAHLVVRANGFVAPATAARAPSEWPERIVVTLQPRAVLRGRVVARGKPIARARVQLLRYDPQSWNGVRRDWCPRGGHFDTRTDDDGRFSLDLEAGEQRLLVEATSLAPFVGDVITAIAGEGLELPLIDLVAGASVLGLVTVAEGAPAVRVPVALLHPCLGVRTVFTDAAGTFRFDHVAAGAYEVRRVDKPSPLDATSRGPLPTGAREQPWKLSLNVPASGEVRHVISLTAHTLHGRCHEVTGRSFAGWRVQLRHCDDGSTVDEEVLEAAGHFTLHAADAGPFDVLVTAPGNAFGAIRAQRRLEPGEIAAPLTLALELAPWRTSVDSPGATWLQVRQHRGGWTIDADGRIDAARGEAALALAPVGEVDLRLRGVTIGTAVVAAAGR